MDTFSLLKKQPSINVLLSTANPEIESTAYSLYKRSKQAERGHINFHRVLILGHSQHSACTLLKELAEANRGHVTRFTGDRVFFDDGYEFIARSVTDAISPLGFGFSQIICTPIFIGPAAKHHLDSIMDRYGVPEEFRWIEISF